MVASLKVTSRCDLRCRHCPWTAESSPDLSLEEWKTRIQALARQGVLQLILEGGEPTLRPDLAQMIEFGRAEGLLVTVATNAGRPLTGLRPDRFLVSIDGLEEVHDRLRGKGAFGRMSGNISGMQAPVVALVSLCRENRSQLRAILEAFHGRVQGFWFSFTYDYPGREPLALDSEERRRAALELLELSAHHPILNTRSFLRGVGTRRGCRPWLMTTVSSDGSQKDGCLVSAAGGQEPDCARCDLPCQRELSDFADPLFLADSLRAALRKSWLIPAKPGYKN
jgi:MoaA/NifB/PqqE/SkfB family radical SAM enzyme